MEEGGPQAPRLLVLLVLKKLEEALRQAKLLVLLVLKATAQCLAATATFH